MKCCHAKASNIFNLFRPGFIKNVENPFRKTDIKKEIL